MDYSIIIPVYNEEKTLTQLLVELKALKLNAEVIIVDDGSTDNSKIILDNQNDFKVINNIQNRGKGYSIIRGASQAKCENIILIDSDMEIDIKCIPELIKLFDSSKSCVVIGSRWKKQKDNKKNINTYANIFINHLFNFLYKTTVNDVLCCVKVIDKNLFKSLDLTSNRFTIEIEIMSKLAIKRIRLIEFDVDYRRRNYNEGKKLRASDGLSIIWEMLKLKIISKRIMPRPQD